MQKQSIVTFRPKKKVKEFLNVLSPRTQDIIERRYGLRNEGKKETLESIGNTYGITRERVRQIETFAINTIRRSPVFSENQHVFNELAEAMNDFGGVVHEDEFLSHLSRDQIEKNCVHFLLVISDYFHRFREDGEFHDRWTTNLDLSHKIHESLKKLFEELSDEDLIAESEILERFLSIVKKYVKEVKDKEIARRWLSLPKFIAANPLGEWGKAHSPNVKAKSVRHLAYLVLRNHGSPMHFAEVAKGISKQFGKKANEATVHNELIKDKRFVLVGRGLYALAEWGYKRGIVRDVIRDILLREGPLTKKEIIDKVLTERHVKENTILVNLQNRKYFKKDKSGRYHAVS